MNLAPPCSKYLSGKNPSHTTKSKLSTHITFVGEAQLVTLLRTQGYLTAENKTTKKALQDGLVDGCENKALWNLKVTKKVLLDLSRKPSNGRTAGLPKPDRTPTKRPNGEIRWGDLEALGAHFGAGRVKVGKWLDELGLRHVPPLELNSSGDVDMLDMARQSQEKFGGKSKVPTKKALDEDYALEEHVILKDKEFTIYKWNIDKCKALLEQKGHKPDKEAIFKGSGRNSKVEVKKVDDTPLALYRRWRDLHNVPATKQSSWDIFRNQTPATIAAVEKLMAKPGAIKARKI